MSELKKVNVGSRVFTLGWFHDYSPGDGTCALRSGETNSNESVDVDVTSCVMEELDEVHEHCLCRIIGTVLASGPAVKLKAQSIRATPSWEYSNFSKRIELSKTVKSFSKSNNLGL